MRDQPSSSSSPIVTRPESGTQFLDRNSDSLSVPIQGILLLHLIKLVYWNECEAALGEKLL